MKVGLITDETDSSMVGLGMYTANITEHLLRLDQKNNYTLIHRKKEHHNIYTQAREIIVPQPAFPLSMYRNFIQLPRRLKQERFDLVHHMSSIGPFVLGKPAKRNIQSILDIIPLVKPETYEWQVRAAFKYLLPRVVKNVDHILTCSESSKRDIVSYFRVPPEKITVTYLGAHERFRTVDKKKAAQHVKNKYRIENFILYVGRLEAKKNIPTLLRAYAHARKNGVREKLVLVGREGYGYEAIRATVKRLSLQKHVVEIGNVPNVSVSDDIVMFYNAARVFAFPSIYEGFGLPVLEAMKCATPVITSNAGSLPEIVGSAGTMCDPFDYRSIAEALRTLTQSEQVARAYSRKGLVQAKKFSWENGARKTLQTYEKVAR